MLNGKQKKKKLNGILCDISEAYSQIKSKTFPRIKITAYFVRLKFAYKKSQNTSSISYVIQPRLLKLS